MKTLVLSNRQRACAVDLRLLRKLTRALLAEHVGVEHYELGVHLVAADEMTAVNETYLQHEGSTDIITFGHEGNSTGQLHGEFYICMDDARKQAQEFGTSWQAELARYVIHGVLHLRGYDDLGAADRRKMKREEGRLLLEIGREFPLSKLARKPTVRA